MKNRVRIHHQRNKAQLSRMLRKAVRIVCREPVENLPAAKIIFNAGGMDDDIWLEFEA